MIMQYEVISQQKIDPGLSCCCLGADFCVDDEHVSPSVQVHIATALSICDHSLESLSLRVVETGLAEGMKLNFSQQL